MDRYDRLWAAGVSAVELRDVFCVHRTADGDAAALQGLSLEVADHQLLCVLGPSGAGKSTLLRVVAGLERPSAGAALVFGRDIGRLHGPARATLRREALGFLDERSDSTLPPDLSVRDCVALPLRLRRVSRRHREFRVTELLDAVGLRDRRGALAAELSGGERQRVALCVAVAHRPRLLLADEPSGELDSSAAATVLGLMAELVRSDGATAVVVSHDPATATATDRTVHLRDGRLVEDGGRDGNGSLVLGRGGWLRLPASLLADAGIEDRVRVRRSGTGLLVTAAPESTRQPPSGAAHYARVEREWLEARVQPARLEACRLACTFGERRVLDGLSGTFAAGAFTAVTGRSGSGKTTLLRLLSGLAVPDQGAVLLDENDLGRDPERLAATRRTRIGYLAQEPAPLGHLTASENIELALALRGYRRERAARMAAGALADVDLSERARQRVARLSAGERQRVGLARALACANGLLILDEPTSRLDEAATSAVADLLARAVSGATQTVVCATHDPIVIARADTVLEL
jgi:ABC-type lipoprotein export system ATPase subunit